MNRLATIDLLRVVGTLAVVLGHIASPFTQYIFLWHMPLFFFISGYTLDTRKSFKINLQKDCRRLLMPFLAFNILAIGVEWGKRLLLGRELENILITLESSFINITSSTTHHYGFVLWFLPALFFGKLWVRFLIKLPNIALTCVLSIVIFIFMTSVPPLQHLVLPFALTQSLLALPFIILGYYVRSHLKFDNVNYWIVILVSLSCILFGLWYFNSPFPEIDIGNNWVLHPHLALIVSSLCCLILYSLVNVLAVFFRFSWASSIASSLMLVFILHPYTNNAGYLLIGYLFGNLVHSWLLILISSLLLLISILSLKKFFHRKGLFLHV